MSEGKVRPIQPGDVIGFYEVIYGTAVGYAQRDSQRNIDPKAKVEDLVNINVRAEDVQFHISAMLTLMNQLGIEVMEVETPSEAQTGEI